MKLTLAALAVIFGYSSIAIANTNTKTNTGQKCIPQKDMQEIARSFSQFRNIAGSDYCLDGSKTSYLIAGLVFMRDTQFDKNAAKSKDELFSGKFASDWWGYFIGRINRFSIQQRCQPGVGAYVYMFGRTMYVCPLLLSEKFSALDRASVMMHEARHIDGFPHTTCRSGPRAGIRGACDDRISSGGSYAVTVETYAQIARYSQGVHPALKSYARASSVIYADEAFDSKVNVDRKKRFLLMTKNRKFHLLDVQGQVKSQTLGSSPHLGRVVMRGPHMVLFPEDKAQRAQYVFVKNEGGIPQEAGQFTEKYNSSDKSARAQVVDFHIGGTWAARILKNRVRISCDARSDSQVREFDLRGESSVSVLYPEGYSRTVSRAHLITDSGRLYEFGCSRSRAFFQASNISLDQPYKRVHKSGSKVLGLTAAGQLFEIQGSTSKRVSTPYDGRIHELIPTESYEFFDGQI